MPSGLVFRIRKASDIVICDYCQHYKCRWLEFSPGNYPASCPEAREIRIADGNIPGAIFLQRTKMAKKIAVYRPDTRQWFISAPRAAGLSAHELEAVIAEARTWSGKNNLALSDRVLYEDAEKCAKHKRLV